MRITRGAFVVLLVVSLMVAAAFGGGPLFAGALYAAGNGPSSVAKGDLDGDEVPDLAVWYRVSLCESSGRIPVT